MKGVMQYKHPLVSLREIKGRILVQSICVHTKSVLIHAKNFATFVKRAFSLMIQATFNIFKSELIDKFYCLLELYTIKMLSNTEHIA